MLARVLVVVVVVVVVCGGCVCLSVCLSVWLHGSSWLFLLWASLDLCYTGIVFEKNQGISKIRVLSFGILYQTLDFKNLSTAGRPSASAI